MATIKSYTSLEQSRKLAEILPLESADMEYMYLKEDSSKVSNVPFVKDDEEPEWPDDSYYDFIPCWSLAALLELIRNFQPNYQSALFVGKENGYQYMSSIDSATHEYNNPIDACYEMILKLHELNLL